MRDMCPLSAPDDSKVDHIFEFLVAKSSSHSRNEISFIIANVDDHDRSPVLPQYDSEQEWQKLGK
jgi:hypothetical protein